MVIGMCTVEVKNNRNIVLGKVVVIAAIVKSVRIVLVIERVIKFNIGILFVYRLRVREGRCSAYPNL